MPRELDVLPSSRKGPVHAAAPSDLFKASQYRLDCNDFGLLAGHSDEDAFRRALLECTCAVRRAVLAFRKDPSRAAMNAIYVDGLPDKLRPLSMARLAKAYKHPVVALITERTSFKTDEVGVPCITTSMPR